MEFCWPISSVFSAPLLKANNNEENSAGPLFFNPSPETLVQLYPSPSHLPPPLPNLTLTSSSSPVPYSTTCDLISDNTLIHSDYQTHHNKFNNNNLQLLTCPITSRLYVFVPAGVNLENIGVLLIFLNKDSIFEVKDNNGKPFLVENNMRQDRIMKFMINPVIDDWRDAIKDDEPFVTIAYLVVCCRYSVSFYSVKVGRDWSCCFPVVERVGFELFKNASFVDVCWSPHLVEECVVLLENGDVLLFDLSWVRKRNGLVEKLILSDCVGHEVAGNGWLKCEFSWHPRILVVVHSTRVFLVDMRSNDFKVTSLLDIESVSGMKNDAFVALSMEADRFTYVLASKELLLLCDVRNPKKPLLTWVHRLKCPNHISVMKLSELRSNSSEEEMYDWASKSGYCILLGSFFDGEFSITCYGPDYGNNKAHCLSKLPNFAWGLPSDISLSGRGCHCGTCFVREEFSKETLHRREKKELVMGFGFLEQEMTSQLSGSNHFAGFHIIRLMSSGKLEVQRYSAAWKLEHMSEKSHKESIR